MEDYLVGNLYQRSKSLKHTTAARCFKGASFGFNSELYHRYKH